MSKKQRWNLHQMSKIDLKLWNFRIRRILVVALIAPLFTAITAVSPQPAYAATIAASDGSCVQDVGSTTGVTVTRIGNDCIIVFTSLTSTTWKAPSGITLVRYLVVGGGASGDRGNCGTYWGRGGGGGEVRDSTLSVTGGTNYTVVVGKGGDASAVGCPNVGGNNGVASQFGSITSSPGLGGQANTGRGGSSGSGQIGGLGDTGALGGGGGGGAGAAGSGKNGGAGVNSAITGSTIMYGSGGAGRDNNGAGTASSGGSTGSAEAAANRGGGGADYGSGWYAGAAGVVVLRYVNLFTVTFDSNGASSGSPSVSSVSQTSSGGTVTLAARGTLSKGSLSFAGWNTQADGKGTNYAASSSFTPTAAVTLFAQWNSVISYDGNTATTTRAIESTTATSNQAATTLSSGRLVRGNPIASGLILNLDAADSSTVSGTTWTNKVSGGTSATIVGSPTYSPTEGAFTLNGSSQYFNLGNTAFNFSGTQNYTINVAFRNNEPMKYASVFSRYNGGVAGNYHVTFDSGKYQVSREVSPWSVTSTSDVDPGRINYVSAVYDGSRLAVFVNGISDGSIAMTGSVGNNSINALIGARLTSNSPTSYLNGKIYSVQVYNRALSASEIATNFQELIPEARVSKTNFTLVPWNTSAAGTGTALGSTVTDLSALPTPYLRLQPSNYNAVAKTWSLTPGSSSFTYRGTPELIASNNGKFGATGNFPVIGGTTSASIYLENPTLTTYTLCVVARYRGLAATPGASASQGRLISGKNENWISGYYSGGVSQFHHNSTNNLSGPSADLNWHYHCDSGNKAYWDGVKRTPWTNTTTTYLPSLGINAGWAGAEFSDWEVADLIIYDQFLPESQIEQINRYFKNTYGILAGPSSTAAAVSVSPSTTYASSGDATLYANWGSAITYDGNKQTSGTAPSPTLITGASGNLASNSGSLVRAGFRFDGWNTNEAGTGTTYAEGSSYPNTGNITLYANWSLKVVFPVATSLVDPIRLSPYMRFKAEDYDATKKIWIDSSGNGRNTSLVRGTPSVITTSSGNGNSKTFKVLSGGTADGIKFANPTFTGSAYTLITVARYSGVTKQRIFDGDGDNYLHGFFNGASGVAHHNGWVTGSSDVHGNNWVLGTSFASNYRSNGVSRGTSGGTTPLGPLSINYGTYFASQSSNFEVAEVLIFNSQLTAAQIAQVEDYLSVTYGITIASPGTYSTSATLAIGAGVGGRSDTYTATLGLGNKTFTMTPSRSGITLETTTANSAVVVVSPTAATGIYAQTLIATDATGDTATYLLNVNVNPAVKFDTSTATTLITTHRRGATLRLNTVFGVGTKVFTMTPAGTGITLDTSTAASGFATLRVDTFTATGTYTQSITVTDDTRIRSTYTVTITINEPPTISSTSAISVSPVTSGLLLNLDAGNRESYSGSGTSWTDLSGNSKNATWQVTPTFTSEAGGAFTHARATNQYATTPNLGTTDLFSVEAWVKFNALNVDSNYPCVISDNWSGSLINYSICFTGNNEIKGGYWRGGWTYTPGFTPVVGTWYHIVYTVSKSGSNYISTLYQNGSVVGSTIATMIPGNSGGVTYLGRRWDLSEYVNGTIPLYRVYNRALSTTEISQNYNALLPRFSNNPTNSVTITTTESVTASSSIYYAGLGTGNKTFALSNPTAGISIDTATVNTVRLNAANTLTATSTTVARSISQVITATDVNGVSAATPVYVTTIVNPKVIITDATPGTLSTTFGRIAYDTFTATQGTGTKIFTVSSTSFASAFVMTNPSTNVGLLTVANNLPAGTYPVTVTATDSVGGINTLALSVVVNPVPTIAGATGNSVTTTLARSTSLRINVIGGTGARTISWTSPNAGITIDSSTITSQNFITLNVSAAVPANTFSFAITAVDSLSARVSDTFTVTVNRWPVIASSSVVQSGLVVNLDASTYSGSGNWLDSSGFGRNAVGATASTTPAGTAPVYSTESGGNFSFNEGAATTNHMLIPNPGTLETFTVSTWVRLKSIPTNNTAIITQYWPGGTNTINYAIGFSGSSIYGAYYRGASNWTSTTSLFTPVINTWYQITYLVSKSGNNYFQDLYVNGVKQGSTVDAGTIAPASNGSVISLGRRWDTASNVIINGAYGNVSIYNRALSAAEILQNYNATGARYVSTNSGSEALTVTQGVAGSLSGVVVSQGTGTKTLALSNTNAGISIDTATANTFSLALANTLTATSTTAARVLTETVTATDQAGATTARIYSITVNPPIRVESTTSIVRTTSGILAWDTFTATLGTGNKTFALAGTPDINGFTLTQSNSQAVLRVGSTVNPGTYTLTITATDAVGAVSTLTKTVVVNTLPTITGNTSVAGTRGYTFNSPTYSAAGGTGNLTFSISTSPAIPGGNVSGIKLSATTGTPTIVVESTTAADTYTVTLRVADSLTAFSTFTVTLKVNPPVTLTGSLTLSKVYGEELSQVYTTGGGTAPFNIFASTVCTSEKSTYVGNGTNGTLGVTYTVEKLNGVGSCNWAVPKDVTNVSVLTVAGGGGGGGTSWAGGGGAGGVVFANSVTVTSGALVPIVVGAGGAGGQNNSTCISGSSPSQGSNGNNSSFNATFTAVGGGGGGGYGWDNRAGCGSGKSGGSGGGSGETDYNPVRATSNQGTFAGATSSGNSGGITVFLSGIQAGSGGGGAGGIGASTGNSRNHVAGNGGEGIAYSITGTSTFYGGGGGGATCISGCTAGAAVGIGGTGGGGNGGHGGASPVNGTNGLGGGGGGSQTGLGATGGSGTVVVRYVTPAVDTETARITLDTLSVTPTGSIRLNAPRNLPVGTYTQSITAIDSSATPASTTATVTLTVLKATPTVALSLPGSVTTAKYGNPVTISAIATTAGNIAFVNGSTNITACTAVATTAGLATCSWTPTAVGSTTLRAQLTPTDTANYNSSALTNLSITVAKADTLTVTVASLARQYTGSAVSVTGAFTATGLVAIDSLTAISMLYSGTANDGNAYSNTIAPTNAGTYSIRPNFPANANAYTFAVGSAGTTSAVSNYESVTVVAGTLTINRAPQVMTFRYPDTNTATYSPTGTITPSATTRLDSAVRSYSSSTLTKCTIDSSTAVISIVEAGSCQVSMAVAQTFNYLADTATATVTINKAARTFSLTPAVSTLKYSESTTVTATLSAGASDGTISYTLGSPAGCTFDPLSGELVAISGTVQCPLTATISEGINYLAETTTAMSLTIARANAPVISIDTVTAMNHTPGVRALVAPSFTVSGLKNSETADSLSFTYSFVSNPFETFTYSDTRTPIDAGTYRITPSALTLSSGLMSNYETPTYSSSAINFIINRIGQESVTIVTTNGEVEVPFTLQASGGSTSGAVTFTKLSGTNCSVTGNSLSATASGQCILSVTRAGNRNYLPFTSESITVMVRNFVIFQVTAPANPVTGITITPTTPIVKGPDVCTSGCVPKLTGADVYDVAEADLIILTGTNLLTVTKVYFNIYIEAPNFTADSDTQISVRVPADLPQGDATIEVVSPGGTSNRLFDFIILP
jgi:uncharacterized repeat protein (TIGR02543 family)